MDTPLERTNRAAGNPVYAAPVNLFYEARSQTSTVASFEQQLLNYKKQVTAHLDGYISWWKMSFFGHHHDARARHLKTLINRATTILEIKDLLSDQQALILNKEHVNNNFLLRDTNKDLPRWWTNKQVKNRVVVNNEESYTKQLESAVNSSGYVKALADGLKI